MATTISQANFEAACGEVYDAIRSSSWASAWNWYGAAEAQHAALAANSAAGPMSISRRDSLEGLAKAIRNAEGAAARYSQTSRLGRMGTRFSR